MILKRAFSFLIVALLCLGTSGAAVLAAPGRFGQTPDKVLPAVSRDTLLNGLRLIALPQEGTGTVKIHFRLNTGSLFDLAGKAGLADLTARMLLKGAAGYTEKNITDTLSGLECTVGLKVGWDSTDISIASPSSSFEPVMDLLGRLLVNPTFNQAELDQLKSSRLSDLIAEQHDDLQTVKRGAIQTLFGAFPYGRPEEGTTYSIARITRDDCVYYHDRFYVANNAEMAVIGDISPAEITRIARSKLGIWKKGEIIPATFRPPDVPDSRQIYLINSSDTAVARASLAEMTISRRATDYFPTLIAAELLSAAAQKGPEISVHSEISPRFLAGPLLVTAKTPVDKIAGEISQLIGSMTQIGQSQITPTQLQEAKNQLISSYLKKISDREGLVDALLDVELYGLGRDYIINYSDRVQAVTTAEIAQAAQSHLNPQTLLIVVAAPASTVESDLRKLGSVTVVKDPQTAQ